MSKSIIELVNSSVSAERYIVVSENLSYQSVFKIIAENLKVKPPHKIASKKLMSLAWRLEALKCFLTKKNPQITKETVKTSSQKNYYQNEKIIKSKDKLKKTKSKKNIRTLWVRRKKKN